MEEVDGVVDVLDAEERGEGGVVAGYGLEHLPGDAAVAEVAGDSGAEFGDVEGFGEVHFEEGAVAGA